MKQLLKRTLPSISDGIHLALIFAVVLAYTGAFVLTGLLIYSISLLHLAAWMPLMLVLYIGLHDYPVTLLLYLRRKFFKGH